MESGSTVSKVEDSNLQTPMMRQWSQLKAQAGSSLLFFRLGDFYELFDEDARIAAPILGIVLTSRNQKSPDAIPLCGIPIHQFDNYISKLLDRNYSVAVAEQVEEPAPGKSLVRREIVQWFTPGIRLLPQDDRSHLCGAVIGRPDQWSLASADVATGIVQCESGSGLDLLSESIERLQIKDLRKLDFAADDKGESLNVDFQVNARPLLLAEAEARILSDLNIVALEDAPVKSKNEVLALGTLLKILADAHPRDRLLFHSRLRDSDAVQISAATRRNLNLFYPSGKSLFDLMDRTVTAFGRRELKKILGEPTMNQTTLNTRRALIGILKSQSFIRKKIRERLAKILDFYRLLRKERGPSELFKISQSLRSAREAVQLLTWDHPLFNELNQISATLAPLDEELSRCLQESTETDRGWIRDKINSELDELRMIQRDSQGLLLNLETRMRDQTQISALKIKFHQTFGYVFEASALHKAKIPDSFKRVQSLANAERFKSKELEELEEKLLSVETRLLEAERAEVQRLYSKVRESEKSLIGFANFLSQIDAAQSLAEISDEQRWSTPESLPNQDPATLELQSVLHPMIPGCVPLDLSLHQLKTQVLLLTGPNMAGKSTLLRMAALCALLHQIGSDVPARKMRATVFDRIMCRMGAQDDLSSGQSTFFIEMKEVAGMLHGSTPQSLLIFDEIGRGTSTYDGMSLAWAIAEEVHRSGSLSLVATHYLELAELERTAPRLKAFHLGVEEKNGKLVFTRKLIQGAASRSYGIHVARLAQVNENILTRAEAKLKELERKTPQTKGLPLFDRITTS